MSSFNSDYSALAHHWVYNRDDSHCYGHRMFSEGDIMYSYGRSYAIAVFLKDKNGKEIVLLNTSYTSQTTGRQTSCVRDAIPRSTKVIEIDLYTSSYDKPSYSRGSGENEVYLTKENIRCIINNLLKKVEIFTGKISKAKSRKQIYIDDRAIIISNIRYLLENFKNKPRLTKLEKEIIYSSEEMTVEMFNKIQKTKEKKRLADRRKARKKLEAEDNEKLTKFLAGDTSINYVPDYLGMFLRLTKDEMVQTSQNMTIKIKHAEVLFNLLKKKTNKTKLPSDDFTFLQEKVETFDFIQYTVRMEDKVLTVGCYRIPVEEVIKIAKQLKW